MLRSFLMGASLLGVVFPGFCAAILEQQMTKHDIGRLPPGPQSAFDDYLDQWLGTSAKPRLRPKSYANYEGLLRLHIRPSLGARPLGAITQFDIKASMLRCSTVGYLRERSSLRMPYCSPHSARRCAGKC
jgi:hypothetical protein